MLTKKERIKYSGLFEQAFQKGKKLRSKNLQLTFTQTRSDLADALPLVGFSISKKFSKKAVIRNRIKRRLREIYRLYRLDKTKHAGLKKIGLLVINVKKESNPDELSFENLKEEFEKLLGKIN